VTYDGQPSETALYGNYTAPADLSVYRDEIVTTMPEPRVRCGRRSARRRARAAQRWNSASLSRYSLRSEFTSARVKPSSSPIFAISALSSPRIVPSAAATRVETREQVGALIAVRDHAELARHEVVLGAAEIARLALRDLHHEHRLGIRESGDPVHDPLHLGGLGRVDREIGVRDPREHVREAGQVLRLLGGHVLELARDPADRIGLPLVRRRTAEAQEPQQRHERSPRASCAARGGCAVGAREPPEGRGTGEQDRDPPGSGRPFRPITVAPGSTWRRP
jgi:hypothetical protein